MKKKPAPEWIAVKDQFPEKEVLYQTYNTETKLFGMIYFRAEDSYRQFVKQWTHYMTWNKYLNLIRPPQ